MEFSEWFNQQLVRFFVNPGHKGKVISFSSSIKNSKTVLISYTAEEDVQPGTLLKFVELLPKSEFTILIKDQTGTYLHPWLSGAGPLILTLPHDLCHPTFWNAVHSDFVQNLTSRSFDTYIDLDPEYN